MMIGPEQAKKASGKSGKKKNKAKKAKRLAAAIDLATPTARDDAGEAPSGAVPDVGPELLAWIDRVQERVDHLLTLVDPALEAPAVEPDAATVDEPAAPATEPVAASEPEATETAPAPSSTDGDDPASADEQASSLAEAWARRQETPEVAGLDDEPFEPVDARLTAILVARELLARGESSADVRRRLREGYGVIDPDAVLAQIAA